MWSDDGDVDASPQLRQRLPRLQDNGVIGSLLPVEVMHGGGQEIRLPLRTDQGRIFEDRGEKFVLVVVATGFAAQPAHGRLHEQRRHFGPLFDQSEDVATALVGIL